MSRVETVEDPEDPRLIDYREIRDAERRRQSGTFIAEGREVVRRLLRTRRYAIRSALVTPPALAALGPALAAGGVRTYLVRQDIREGHRGDRVPSAWWWESVARTRRQRPCSPGRPGTA